MSGLNSSRVGYCSLKKVLEADFIQKSRRSMIDTTYVDDLSRATRDRKELWELAAFIKALGIIASREHRDRRAKGDTVKRFGANQDPQVLDAHFVSRPQMVIG